MLSEAEYPLPPSFDQAYGQADIVALEVEPGELMNPQAMFRLQSAMLLPEGHTLESVLDKKVYQELEQFLSERQLPISNFLNFNPMGISMTLTILELQRLGLSGTAGVDSYYGLRAKNENKKTMGLETMAEQIAFIEKMAESDPNAMVTSTMRDLGDLQSMWKTLLSAWRNGDMQKMDRLLLEPMRKEFPNIYQVLLVKRNADWLPKLADMMNTEPVELVLVGSLHMVGDDGLLSLLKSRGYTIEQM